MAEKSFIIRDKKTNNIFRIRASSKAEAKSKLRKLDQSNTAQVAVTPDGIPIKNSKGDAVLRSPQGNLTLVGEGYSTSDPEKIKTFTEK